MKFGIIFFPTDENVRPSEWAKIVEEMGFESLWFPEHSHIPASRETPYPAGGEIPRNYVRLLDPFIALTSAAAATERLRLGTGICQLTEHDPILVAKAVASIDWLSHGRFEFGIGAGWNREELRNHGTDPSTRLGLLGERLEAVCAIWTQDEASYAGEFVEFERIWSWPKPLQSPHPPIHVGGAGPKAMQLAAGHADGWMPIGGRAPDLPDRIHRVRQQARELGRTEPQISIYGASADPGSIEQWAEIGVERLLFWVRAGNPEEALEELQGYAKTVESYACS